MPFEDKIIEFLTITIDRLIRYRDNTDPNTKLNDMTKTNVSSMVHAHKNTLEFIEACKNDPSLSPKEWISEEQQKKVDFLLSQAKFM